MKILFIHQNFPGQFPHLSAALAAQGHEVIALCINQPANPPKGVRIMRYPVKRGTSPNIHPWASEFETKIIRGEACLIACKTLKTQGFMPDIIIAHPGWGEALFAKDVWQDSKLLNFHEFYYHARGFDGDFDAEFQRNKKDQAELEASRLRLKNTHLLHALAAMDWGISPTTWQRSSAPQHYQSRISVIHEGINTQVLTPLHTEPEHLATGLPRLSTSFAEREIITFVSRNLEPYRGYHIFMRALPKLLKARPKAHVWIIGSDGVSYGSKPPAGKTWKQIFYDEVRDNIDLDRVFFLGNLPHASFTQALQLSSCHVYLTYPFVLSWSLLEALSIGAAVVASRTPPVEEVIEHKKNGWLVDFFDHNALSEQIASVLESPKASEYQRESARKLTRQNYDLQSVCLPRQLELIHQIVEGRTVSC